MKLVTNFIILETKKLVSKSTFSCSDSNKTSTNRNVGKEDIKFHMSSFQCREFYNLVDNLSYL